MSSPDQTPGQAVTRLTAMVSKVAGLIPKVYSPTVTGVNPLQLDGAEQGLTLKFLSSYRPFVNDTALVLQVGTSAWVIGGFIQNPSRWPPGSDGAVGTVTSGSSTVPVTVDGTVYQVVVTSNYAPATGDLVRLAWTETDSGWDPVIVGKRTNTDPPPPPAQPPAPPPPPPPPPVSPVKPVQTGVAVVRATTAATWRGGWRTDRADIYQGVGWGSIRIPNHGYWFHGSGFGGLTGVTCTSAQIWMQSLPAGDSKGTTVRLVLHGHKSKGAGEPNTLAVIAWWKMTDTQSGWFDIPTEWGQRLIDGGAGGVGVVADVKEDYAAYASLARDVQSGAIRLGWRKGG